MNVDWIVNRKGTAALIAIFVVFLILLALIGPGIIFLFVMIGIIYGLVRVTAAVLSRPVSRIPLSIRWKILGAILLMGVLLIVVSVVNAAAMDYMHTELHEIQNVGGGGPLYVLAAVDRLENTQHGAFFSFLPLLSVLGGIAALAVGVAIAISVITPIRRMSEGMRRIAAGDFSQAVQVDNRDELGELAQRINDTAKELARLQDATVAAERARSLRERVAQVTLAQEEERRRISRELHDDLGPSLAAIVNRLRTCQKMMRSDPEQAERELEEVTQGLKGHIQGIRNLIHDLRPLAVDQLGLSGAIQQQIERFTRDTGIEVSPTISRKATVDPLAEVTVFRVLQECLSNVQKHSKAAHVEIALQRAEGGVELIVRDDGRGFTPAAIDSNRNGQGVGLAGMRERAELAGGRLTVSSSPGGGCAVSLFTPSDVRAASGAKEEDVGADTHPVG